LVFDGFADEIGSDSYNYALSERRARKVSDFLRNNGIPGQFSIYGRGRIKLSPDEIKEEVGSSYWTEGGIDWIQVNRRARRVEIYNKR
jgi:outer membrane protein OmpA-like peptidoglycan-associated protein